jgi:hypothetical protein
MNDHVSIKFTKEGSLLHFAQIGLDGAGTQPGSSTDNETWRFPLPVTINVRFLGNLRNLPLRAVTIHSPILFLLYSNY